MKLREELCRAIVDGWNQNWFMMRVVDHAWRMADEEPKDALEKYTLAAKALNVPHIRGTEPVKGWLAKHMPQVNDALWGSRPTETCVNLARRLLGTKLPKGRLIVSVRERDKRRDWGTVK